MFEGSFIHYKGLVAGKKIILISFAKMYMVANSAYHEEIPPNSVASDQSLHCKLMPHLKGTSHKWLN